MILFKKIECNEINHVIKLLKQPMLKNPEGKYSDKDWINKLISKGYSIGGYINDEIISCVIGECLTDNGILLWFCAVNPKYQSMGYGEKSLRYFENFVLRKNKTWIFLNATKNSIPFYQKNKYKGSVDSPVVEYLKYLK